MLQGLAPNRPRNAGFVHHQIGAGFMGPWRGRSHRWPHRSIDDPDARLTARECEERPIAVAVGIEVSDRALVGQPGVESLALAPGRVRAAVAGTPCIHE